MAYVMETTLAQLPPDAAMALKVAALLPADAVPWPWVAQILVRRGATTPRQGRSDPHRAAIADTHDRCRIPQDSQSSRGPPRSGCQAIPSRTWWQ